MPAYMTNTWSERGLKFKPTGTGIRRFIPLPYFSGTELSVNIITYNNSHEGRELRIWGKLSSADFHFASVTGYHSTDIHTFTINPKGKAKHRLRFTHLPQPGNYSVELGIYIVRPETDGSCSGNIVYFDALPRDATITNWTINILMLVLGTLLGGLAGWIAGSIGNPTP